MYHVCPKRRLAKTIELAPVKHTWANIVSGTTTSVDVPGNSDPASMDTDTGSQMVGEKISSATDGGKRKPVPVSIEGRQQICDASTSHTTVISKQVSSTHAPWNGPTKTPTLSGLQQRRQDPQETPLPQLRSGPPSTNLPPIIKTSILPKYTLPSSIWHWRDSSAN